MGGAGVRADLSILTDRGAPKGPVDVSRGDARGLDIVKLIFNITDLDLRHGCCESRN